MVNTKVTLCGVELDNPVIPASGTFGYGYEFAELYDINMLGTFSFKGTTREPRFGNPTPRIAEYAGGLREVRRAGAGGLAGGQYLLPQRPRRRRGLRRGPQVRCRGDEGGPGSDEKAHHFKAVPHGG